MKKTILIFSALIVPTLLFAQSPYGFRGPNRSGVYNEVNLLKEWPAEGPQLIWENLDIGKGYSSPVIVDDRIYVTALNSDETSETFSAYNLEGEKLYTVEYGEKWEKTYPETRTTPTIDNGKAYVISGMGQIVCLNISDGHIVWKVDGANKFEQKTGSWGTCESPLVYDDKIIYTPAGDITTMVALDNQTGETIWQTKTLSNKSTYVSPILIDYKGQKKIIALTERNVFCVNPQTGDIDWTFSDWGRADKKRENIATNSPLFYDGKLFISNGYDAPAFMLKINDEITDATLLWRNNDMDTHHGGQVLVNGVIYGSNWTSNNAGNWCAVDWESGNTLYDTSWGGGKSKGSIISADNMLYIYDERRGYVGLVNPNPAKFDVVSEFRITKGEGPHWAHPVINNGVLYIRHGNALMAFSIKK